MPRLIWSPKAVRDIGRLYRFLAPKNPDAAKRAARSIRQGVKVLAEHPEVGRLMDDLPAEYRELLIGFGSSGYVAAYRYDGLQVLILTVRHARETGPQPIRKA